MSRPTFSFQALEPRRFLSATVEHLAACPEVTEAREELQSIIVERNQDRRAARRQMGAIRAEIIEELRKMHEENGDALAEAVAPLRRALRAALHEQGEARREVLAELQGVREKWQPTILADLAAIRDARQAGDEDAVKEAIDKFHADRAALYGELNVLKEKLHDVTVEKGEAVIAARLAIEDKLAEFSDTLKDLLEKQRARAKEIEQILIAGHNKVVAAQEALKDAIADCREEHAGEHTA